MHTGNPLVLCLLNLRCPTVLNARVGAVSRRGMSLLPAGRGEVARDELHTPGPALSDSDHSA